MKAHVRRIALTPVLALRGAQFGFVFGRTLGGSGVFWACTWSIGAIAWAWIDHTPEYSS